MNTNITNIKHLCALLLSALAFVACSSDSDEILNQPEPQQPAADGIHFSAVFDVKNAPAATRALTDPGDGTLTATWQVGEEIAIIFGGTKYTATVTTVDATGTATVSATLPSTTPNNQAVTFIYPASAADGSGVRSGLLDVQDGKLSTISRQLDVATAEGTIVIDGTDGYPNGTVTLENLYAICKLQFTDESGQAITDIFRVSVTDLSTKDNVIVIMPSAQSAVYVAMKPTSNTVKFLVARSDGTPYSKVAVASLQAGKFYHPTLSATLDDAITTPLTLEAIESGTVSFLNNAAGSVYYSIDGGARTEIPAGSTGTTPTLTAGQEVAFYGDNATYTTSSNYSKISCTAGCYVFGNIMSLISSTDFPNCKTLTESETFVNLFYSYRNSNNIYNHVSQLLVLPATTLTDMCYLGMFSSCTSLTAAPMLPATTLASSCYRSMFSGCTRLIAAPALPATTLADDCYHNMFSDCTSLTTVPAQLPATTLESACYERMFSNCTSLTTAPMLPATTLYSCCYIEMFRNCTSLTNAPDLPATMLEYDCYEGMFSGCTSLTKAPDLPAAKLADYCYRGMFSGCTSLTKAPDLPAAKLQSKSYYQMFYGCTSLRSIKCLATNISASDCTADWLSGVSATGTFTKASSMESWTEGASGIPTGWTVENE